MKRSIWVRLIAMILVISMLAAPVSAATVRGPGHSTNGLIGAIIGIIKDIIKDIIDDWFDIPGVGDPDPTEPPVPTTPEEPTAPSEPAVTDPTEPEVTEPEETEPEVTEPEVTEPEAPEYELNLVEGHANTVNGNLLRGVTYSLTQLVAQEPQTAPYALRSTGYALNAVAEETTTISDTALVITYDENGNALIPDGQYVLYCSVNNMYLLDTMNTNSPWNTTLNATSNKANATVWTFTRQADGSYTVTNAEGKYATWPSWCKGELSDTAVYMDIEQIGANNYIKNLNTYDNHCYLNALGNAGYFGAYEEGSPIFLYAVTTTEPEQPEEPEQPDTNLDLIYFPVTMFNYKDSVIRELTHQVEVEAGLKDTWQGLYFSGGSPSPTTYTYSTGAVAHSDLTWQQVMDGTYYADEACTNQVTVEAVGDGGSGWNAVTLTAANDAYVQYPQYADGNYYYKNGDNYEVIAELSSELGRWYIYYGESGWDYANVAGYELTIYTRGGETTGYTLTADGDTLATLDGTDLTAKVGVPLYTPAGETTVTKSYAAWNWWSYKPDNNNSDNAQNKFYAGLVQEELVENELKFNIPEPGIFTFDPTKPEVTNDGIKDIYQNVGLPFFIDEDGFYTFDSDENGTYFADNDDADNKSNPGYGSSDKYFDMYFDYQNTQGWADKSDPNSNLGYGDGSTNLWAPFNTNDNDNYAGEIDYHFGMRADIPFSMTPNGCIKSTDDNSPPIKFKFQGDDDVWIFIDGHLVIDLGGIHNRLGAEINFADNTITYYLPESNNNDNPFGAFNLDGFELVQKLYDDASGEGALGQTRTDFSSQEKHHMTIFYLERGEGTSNCKIQFNLPMRDTLMVTKDASMSWSEKQDEADKEKGDGTAPLTSSEQAAVNNIPFGFTLYKKEANATGFTPVANTNYFLQDQKGVVKDTLSTDANGHFYLKNGETAKFMTDFPKEGVTYYVVEDKTPDGFLTPDFQFKGKATNGFDWYNADGVKQNQDRIRDASVIPEQEIPMPKELEDGTLVWPEENKSYTITAYGSVEAIDSLEFICVNYMNAELPSPTALAYEDMIVIDYGLPVQIDPLANDLFRGNEIEIVAWGDENLTLNAVDDGYGNHVAHDDPNAQKKTTWSGGKEFHSGNVTFNDVTYSEATVEGKTVYTRDTFTYTLNKQLTEVEVISYIVKVTSSLKTEVTHETKTACRYALAKVYIAPATIMYYEENFSDMVTFTGSGWNDETTVFDAEKVSPFQEPGVVGDSRNHTYGTDSAYLEDNSDSNGTHRFGKTDNGAIRFTYTFTGTGTSIFARTSDKTGYMQVKIYEGKTASGNYHVEYRDTYWKNVDNGVPDDDSGVLYNIPVYTNEDLDYGTYTVVCTVAKAGTPTEGNIAGAGNEFYLDGIRVMQPLNKVVEKEAVYDEETDELISPTVYDAMTNKVLNAYTIDGESNLDVVTLRQKLITDAEDGEAIWDGENFVVLTDINGEITTAGDYTSIGPKEEVYLAPGQKVTFSLKYWQPEGLKLYAGMKAPFGSGKLKVGHDVYELKNAADCYYDVTDNSASLVTMTDEDGYEYYVVTYTFEATDKIVSLTNIKVVGSHEFTIIENTDINQ